MEFVIAAIELWLVALGPVAIVAIGPVTNLTFEIKVTNRLSFYRDDEIKVTNRLSLNRDDGGLLPDAYLHLVRKKGS